ncbi:FAD-dependent oxidoreductase [Streptomyces sp. NPDC008313]|uniref:FAD-dependent oxidoreductase n=1 Tax=Streptomyces sp. NPDC008313 TaxID=3364826 RepID=UPI0036ED4817
MTDSTGLPSPGAVAHNWSRKTTPLLQPSRHRQPLQLGCYTDNKQLPVKGWQDKEGVAASVEVHPVERDGPNEGILDRARRGVGGHVLTGAVQLVPRGAGASAVQDGHIPALQRVGLRGIPRLRSLRRHGELELTVSPLIRRTTERRMWYHDVGIIGGGCAGLFLARELAARNCDCIVIEKDPAAGHASTRNQGWLQSGSFYAAANDPVAAQGCREGYKYITQTYLEAIQHETESYCLFRSQQGLAETLERCQRENIPINAMTDNEIQQLQDSNPILRGTPLDYVAKSEDRPFDTRHLLQIIANEIASYGVQQIKTASIDDIVATRRNDRWQINPGDGASIGCKALILACGPYIPQLLQSIAPQISPGIRITKTPVLILKGDQVCRPAIMMPLEPGGPNIVPFKPFEDIAGVSVCLSRTDYPIDRANNYSLPPRTLEAFAASLESHLPGLLEVIQAERKTVEAHFYMCQKVKGESRAPLTEYHEVQKLGIFYPGKFTSSPITARRFAKDLYNRLGKTSTASSRRTPLRVARQCYYDKSSHRLEAVDGRLRFRRLR